MNLLRNYARDSTNLAEELSFCASELDLKYDKNLLQKLMTKLDAT